MNPTNFQQHHGNTPNSPPAGSLIQGPTVTGALAIKLSQNSYTPGGPSFDKLRTNGRWCSLSVRGEPVEPRFEIVTEASHSCSRMPGGVG